MRKIVKVSKNIFFTFFAMILFVAIAVFIYHNYQKGKESSFR